jgi:hypothetical protein
MAVIGAAAGMAVAPALLALVAWMYGTANATITGFRKFKGWGLLLFFVWFLGAGFAGGVVGSVVGFLGWKLHCRAGAETRAGAALSFLLTALGLYAYYALWTLEGLGEQGWRWVAPGEIASFMQTYLSDRATSGKVMAYAVYAFEALVYWAGVVAGLEHFLQHPYCEACGQWTTTTSGLVHLELPDEESRALLDRSLQDGELEILDQLERANPTQKECIRVDLYACPSCQDSRWATFKQDSNPIFEEEELDALEAVGQLRRLTSAKGIAKTLKQGTEEEMNREFELKRLRVDEAFAQRYRGEAS